MAQSRNDTDLSSEFNTEETCTVMLQSLTVAELKHVLKHFGCPLGGKKSVLQSRALGTLRLKGSSKMGAAIQQIPRISQKLDTLKRFKGVGFAGSVQPRDPAPTEHPNTCQNVNFKESIFYTSIDTLVNPTLLLAKRKNSQVLSYESVKISLTASQAADLRLSEKIGDDDSAKVFVHLRFCKNIPGEPQDDCYPSFCDIGAKVHFDWYPFTLNGEKMISAPVDITPLFNASRLRHGTQITLLIRWFNKSATFKEFVYNVTMVKRRAIEDVVKKIPVISAADTRAKIKAKLSAFTSNEVSSSGQQISFQCPLSMSRLKDPCRGANCKHLQCFDACSYLELNRTKPRWICPVCQQKVPFSELEIDGLQLEILHHSTIVKIEFDADGCWHPVLNDNRKRVVSVDDDDYVDPLLKKKCNGDKLDVIDLTNDSPPHSMLVSNKHNLHMCV